MPLTLCTASPPRAAWVGCASIHRAAAQHGPVSGAKMGGLFVRACVRACAASIQRQAAATCDRASSNPLRRADVARLVGSKKRKQPKRSPRPAVARYERLTRFRRRRAGGGVVCLCVWSTPAEASCCSDGGEACCVRAGGGCATETAASPVVPHLRAGQDNSRDTALSASPTPATTTDSQGARTGARGQSGLATEARGAGVPAGSCVRPAVRRAENRCLLL